MEWRQPRSQTFRTRPRPAVQGMNIGISPPEGKIKYFGQLVIFKKRSPSRVRTPRPMRVGNLHEPQTGVDVTKTPTGGLDASVTPSLLHASGTWTMTEEMRKNLQTTQRRMMRMIIQANRKSGPCPAAAHAANVDKIAYDERHERSRGRYDCPSQE